MPINAMPAVDALTCAGWSENDLALYQSLPFYLAKTQVDMRKTWEHWARFCKKRRWQPNQGDTLRGVRTNPSPHLRQFANPALLRNAPLKDVMDVRETTAEANLYLHRFESPSLNFFPSFNDFLDHVDAHGKDIMEKIDRYKDMFIRGRIFHMAPYGFVCQGNTVQLTNLQYWSGTGTFDPATQGKTTAQLLQMINGAGGIPQITSHLTLPALNHALTIMETDLRVPFFSGSGLPQDDKPLQGMFCLSTSSETYNQFTFDPWLLQNKNCDFDVINGQYYGKIFGRITSKLEDMPLRFQNTGVFQEPELRVGGAPGVYNLGESNPNLEYTLIDETGSPYEVSWLIGGTGGYEIIDSGPPPSAFTGNSPPHNFPGMKWNGEVYLTKQFLIPCVDASTGTTVWEMNSYGRWIRYQSELTLGILGVQRRNIIPIFHKRKRGANVIA